MDEKRLLSAVAALESEHGMAQKDKLLALLLDVPQGDLLGTLRRLQLKALLYEPMEGYFKVVVSEEEQMTSNAASLVWEERTPKTPAAAKKGPYEFTKEDKKNLTYRDFMKKVIDSGSYHVTVDGYTYWLMPGGLARRKVKDDGRAGSS